MQIEGFKRSISELSVMKESAVDKTLSLMVTEWTNEKHNLYLKSMEASFVNQLHNSMDELGWSSLGDHSTHVPTDASSGQRLLGKSTFEERRSTTKQILGLLTNPWIRKQIRARPRGLLTNPWIRHFRSSTKQENIQATREKNQLEESTKLSKRPCTESNHFSSWHSQLRGQDSDDNNEEESAQNFLDEDIKRGVVLVEGTFGAKRIKTLIVNESSNDQVVPKGKCPEEMQ